MTEKILVTTFDNATGLIEKREATQDEVAQQQLIARDAKAIELKLDAKIAARQSALAKLAALGLTEEEIGAL